MRLKNGLKKFKKVRTKNDNTAGEDEIAVETPKFNSTYSLIE